MSAREIAVVGAGVAGLSAAWSLARAGASVTIIERGAGASSLNCGAIDDAPWEDLERAASLLGQDRAPAAALSEEEMAFAKELDIWDVPRTRRCLLATAAGRLRGARGRDRGLLDLESLAGQTVALPRVDRAGWDADALAASLTDDPVARSRSLTFVAADVGVLRFDEERFLGDADLAARHDDPARLGWLGAQLQGFVAHGNVGGFLLGPWLGLERARSPELGERLRVPVGEILVGSGSPAGLRFERARARLLARISVTSIDGRVTRVARADDRIALSVASREGLVHVQAVILALGGVLSGGIVYRPPERAGDRDFPARGDEAFHLSLDAPAELRLGAGHAFGIASSMQAPELDLVAWPRGARSGLLEQVGVACAGPVSAAPSIFAAGDVVAGRPRTVLEAVTSGLAAARAALHD